LRGIEKVFTFFQVNFDASIRIFSVWNVAFDTKLALITNGEGTVTAGLADEVGCTGFTL
jgi:hypothetical protein